LNPRSTKHGILSATPLTKLGYWCIMHIDDALSTWSVRGSNPRLCAHKTHTLPTELTDLVYLYSEADYFPLHRAGFEPAKHEATHLECVPFDQTREPVHNTHTSGLLIILIIVMCSRRQTLTTWSVRGSNPRLCAHKTHTLPTELTDHIRDTPHPSSSASCIMYHMIFTLYVLIHGDNAVSIFFINY
jgi:hypothetical protein